MKAPMGERTLNRATHPPAMEKRTGKAQQKGSDSAVTARRGRMSDDLGSEGGDESQGCQATPQLQNINLQLNSNGHFQEHSYLHGELRKGVVVSPARDWGPAEPVLKQKRGSNLGASQ